MPGACITGSLEVFFEYGRMFPLGCVIIDSMSLSSYALCVYTLYVRKEKIIDLYTNTNHAKHQCGLDLGCEGVPSAKGTPGIPI